jgi:hypothetical protein
MEVRTMEEMWRERKTGLTSGHNDRGDYQQFTIVTSENAEEPENNDGASQDAEANWNTTDTDAGGIMTVDVESLCWPEHDYREEVGAGDKGDDQCQSQNARFLLEARREHGEFGKLHFPDGESDTDDGS